ncbi:hypothetical protein AF71_00032490 [Rhizobium sp. 57MFTsu3.2]|nr:hypothetical protein [Rhizobium sp. 57MFTsu3.2]
MLQYMLDTNVCIFTMKNRRQQVREAAVRILSRAFATLPPIE